MQNNKHKIKIQRAQTKLFFTNYKTAEWKQLFDYHLPKQRVHFFYYKRIFFIEVENVENQFDKYRMQMNQ